jgi:hypothetical protein
VPIPGIVIHLLIMGAVGVAFAVFALVALFTLVAAR